MEWILFLMRINKVRCFFLMYKDHMLLFVYLIDFVMIKITSEKVVRNDQQTDVFMIRRERVCVFLFMFINVQATNN